MRELKDGRHNAAARQAFQIEAALAKAEAAFSDGTARQREIFAPEKDRALEKLAELRAIMAGGRDA